MHGHQIERIQNYKYKITTNYYNVIMKTGETSSSGETLRLGEIHIFSCITRKLYEKSCI
jgi:hypothetical protein